MIGLVIVAHQGLAEALLATTEHVVGPQGNAFAIGALVILLACIWTWWRG